jgi:transcriptional regulator with GAF, ATPase, and Fis domain
MPTCNVELRADEYCQLEIARTVHSLATRTWGRDHSVVLIGRHPSLATALQKLAHLAAADAPLLIVGETGTGKELFARALFLLSRTHRRTFVTVNCAQYVNEQLMISELFGHKKGSFTGAVSDHAGIFSDADGGVVFLDEIGELPPAGQAILLRALSEGEILPVGSTRPKRVNVRVVAATNRDLRRMVEQGKFREDLYFRLRQLQVRIPPLRERGSDWELIADYCLARLAERNDSRKWLADDALSYLHAYDWPGNIRELRSCIQTGYYVSTGKEITLSDLGEALEEAAREQQLHQIPLVPASDYCLRLVNGEGTFWELVYKPFMDRDLNRGQVREIIGEGLRLSDGSYKGLLDIFGVEPTDYLKFMDFLRHHRLKPETGHRRTLRSAAPLRAVSLTS